VADPVRGVDHRLVEIFRSLTGDPALELTRQTRRNDVPKWDSMVHIQLVLSVEKEFGIKFSPSDIAKFSTVSQLCDLIDVKTSGR